MMFLRFIFPIEGKLPGLFVPDDKFVGKEVGILQIFWHGIMPVKKCLMLADGIGMPQGAGGVEAYFLS